eukprot:g3813.t1
MEMYAPSFDSCLDPRLGMPETLEEVLLNRTSFTQAYVEQQSKLNEQKFLALSRNFELFKTRLEQTQLLRNNEIEARITNIEGKVEKCMRQISGILDRLVDCESLTNVKTSLNTKFNTLQSKINEQSEYFEMNTNEIVKRVVAAIKEEQQGRQAFEESIRSEKNELDKKLDLVFNKIDFMLQNQKLKKVQYGYKQSSSKLANSSRKDNIKSNRKKVLRSQSHSDILYSRSPKSASSPHSLSGSISSRFKDSNNMESPNNRRNLVDSPPVTARQILATAAKSGSKKPNSAQEGGDNIIESLPVLDMSNSVVEESDQVTLQYKRGGSSSEDDDDAPPPFEPWMQNQNSNRYGDTSNISIPKKQKYGWGRLTSFVKQKLGRRRKANSFA